MKTTSKLKLIEFLDGLYFATIITSLFAVSKGITLSQIVIAQGLYSLIIIVMEVPTGLIADKFGRKFSMALGYILNAAGIILFTFLPSVINLYIMRFLQSTGSALVSGANEALLYEASKDEGLSYKKQISILNSNSIIGLCIAGGIAGVAYQLFASRSFVPILLLTALIQIIAFVISLTIEEKSLKSHISIVKKELRVFHLLTSSISLIRKNKTIFALTMFGMLAACNEYFVYQTYAPYFKDLGIANLWVASAFSLGLLLNFLITRNIWKLEKYMTLEKALALIKILAIIGYLGLALVTQSTFLVIILISTIGIFNIEKPIISDFANQEIDSHNRSTVLSGMSLVSRITKAILTFIVAAIIARGSVTSGYLISAMYLIFGTAIAYWLLVRCGCVRRVSHTTN